MTRLKLKLVVFFEGLQKILREPMRTFGVQIIYETKAKNLNKKKRYQS